MTQCPHAAGEGRYSMNDELLGKVVPVKPIGIEKVSFRTGARYLDTGASASERKTYSFNVLYANILDPADGVHKFPLMPENPNFIIIDSKLKIADANLKDIPLENQLKWLPESMTEGMFGAWVNVDLSKRPVVRLYTANVVELVNGVPEVKHKIGEPMHKTANGKETKEYAAITQMPVWGFLKKNLEGQFFWLKGYDPMTRIDREINQGRMVYLDTLIGEVHDDKGLDTGDATAAEDEQKVEKLPDAPDLNNLG